MYTNIKIKNPCWGYKYHQLTMDKEQGIKIYGRGIKKNSG